MSNNVNGYFEEINKNKYLALVPIKALLLVSNL